MDDPQKEQTDEVENQYFDRDLSWMRFNHRVLLEAQDSTVPLLERLRFLAIYSSNQDEFFRVRVAKIRRLVEINKKKINRALDIKPKTLLKKIHKRIHSQLDVYGDTLRNQVLPELKEKGVCILKPEQLSDTQKNAVFYYFKIKVLSFLQPYHINHTERPAFLNNRALYFGLRIRNKLTQEIEFAYLNIPSDHLPRFYKLPILNHRFHYIFLDDVIVMHLDFVFPNHDVLECKCIKMNKDADLNITDEYSGDLVEKIQKQIKKRNLGTPSRFLHDRSASSELLDAFRQLFDLDEDDLVSGGQYHSLYDFMQFPNPIGSSLEYEIQSPLSNKKLDSFRSIFSAMDASDHMLHFPYHTYNYVLQFFNLAAIDPQVTDIKVTFYRMASKSLIGNALISAAKNGKKVTVFIELKARFDEANNLEWAEKMQQEGIHVIYSIPGLKVHAKVAMVRRLETDGSYKNYCFFGTGNLNEQTATTYCDHGLLTCNPALGKELNELFIYLHDQRRPNTFEHLLVSQFNIIDRFTQLIDREIVFAKEGKKAKLTIKLNNLEDHRMIDQLYAASRAGVEVRLIVRSICCLIPGIVGMSENITVRRIVGRYLEHARVFCFHNNGNEELYMGSADWMTRNLKSRVEVTFPIYDDRLKNEIKEILGLQLNDNIKAVMLDEKQNNVRVTKNKGDISCDAQLEVYRLVKSWEK